MLDFKRFEISHYGFLPVEEPLRRLPDAYYEPWEAIISRIDELIRDRLFYLEISKLPVLDTKYLQTVPEWQRAYVILCFFTHAHIWSDDKPREVLPVNIARPLLEVSKYLDLPPIATYPALNLWNCGLIRDDADITDPDNVVMRHTLTGTMDESWFYAVSVSVEAKGVSAIQVMLECIDAINDGNEELGVKCLESFGKNILELRDILHRMHEKCDPAIFYYRIRPFLAGTKGMERVGLPRGVFYDEGNGQGSFTQYSGGSNAQSTLIQFLDIALGVEHHASGVKTGKVRGQKRTYLGEMRKYMPRSHREFLEYFSTIANVQQHTMSSEASPDFQKAFDEAVDALTAFRDTHIKIVARYIVAPSRAPGQSTMIRTQNIASASSSGSCQPKDLKGTGGTDLMIFLKQTRDETKAAKDVAATET